MSGFWEHLVRWLGVGVAGLLGLFVLGEVVSRTLRHRRPALMPLYVAPRLNWAGRWRLFGTPEQVLDRAGVTPGLRVLEVGPGPGFFTVPLARRVADQEHGGGGSVTCVEIQPALVEMLQERLRATQTANVEVIQGDGRQMPLPANRFELVLLIDVLGETPDMPALFRECARVLKPGGMLAVTEEIYSTDFRLPRSVRRWAVGAGLAPAGQVGWPWWGYTVRYRKPETAPAQG
jgi:SAM-dependent methyltransferase